ncbi:Ig-like domain-containing protein [uncultured Erythrobacter sp.]|uniref:Ig-like domain-containing protein n=1 Tax=uncultured Erythrobacter sp. TaxID=263913 RepID=UPI0026035484|nr:Ig-like domain-containing protein [uncultured Erythrobacter sp.]
MSHKAVLNSHLIALEPRMMFDGAGVVTAVAVDVASLAFSSQEFQLNGVAVAPLALDSRHDQALLPFVTPNALGSVGSDGRANGPSAGGDVRGDRSEVGDDSALLSLGAVGLDRVPMDEIEPTGVGFVADAIRGYLGNLRQDQPVSLAREVERALGGLSVQPWALEANRWFSEGGLLANLELFETQGGGFDLDTGLLDPFADRASTGNDYIFIDTSVENYQELAATWRDRGTIVFIDSSSDGVDQMLAALAGASDIGAIHIVSHGENGMFWLGGTRIDSAALTGELAASFASLGAKLSVGGDILLYGCDVGADAVGQQLIDNLAAITGADIAASIDDTGSILRGGDWTLENRLGLVETASLVAENWQGLLAPTALVSGAFDVFNENGTQVADGTRVTTAGSSAVWFNVATVNGQNISVRATIVSITAGANVQFSGPGDDFGIFLRKPVNGLGTVEIQWDIFFTNTGAPANVDVNFTVADIDGAGAPQTREFLVIDTGTLSSFQSANGTNVDFDTSDPGIVIASGTADESGGVPSAARFNWLDTNSFTIEYNLANGFTGAFFRHDGDADFDLGTGGTTVSIPRLDLDQNNSTANGSAYSGTFVENGAAVGIVDSDVQITNPVGRVEQVTITLTNPQSGDELLVNGSTAASGSLGGGLTYTRTATEIIITGSRPAAVYENALEAITFQSLGERPSEVDRTIDIFFENSALSSNVATATINVIEVNDPPTAVDDPTQTTDEDTPLANINVLGNDSDGDGDPLTVISANASSGTVTINGDGTLNYAPNANFSGTDTITYTISDGRGGTSTAIVPIVIDAVNDRPTLDGNLPPQANQDAQQGIFVDVSGGFDDVEDSNLTFSASNLPAGLSIDSGTGFITGTIDNSASQGGNGGVYTVTITATDSGGLSATQDFSWTVTNPPPQANNDGGSTLEDTPVTFDVLANDQDPDGDDISVVAASAPNGSVVINPDGTITYTPNANFNGPETITYSISDGEGGTSMATVSLFVTAQNDAPMPVGNLPPQTNLDADGGISVDTAAGFNDIDGPTTIYSAAGLPPGLSINTNTGEITGTIDNSASQGGTGGVYTVTVTLNDGAGGMATQTFSWTVTNPGPTANDDTAATDEDTPVNIAVLGNDTDPDGDSLSVVSASAPNGMVVIEADGTLTYTPDADFNGTDTITYKISDGEGGTSTAEVEVTVSAENDAPVPTGTLPPQTNLDADGGISVPTAGAFADVDDASLSYGATGLPPGLSIDSATGEITGTIDNSASIGGIGGVYDVVVTATDASGASADQSFSWTVTNPAPIAVDDTAATDEDTPVVIDVLPNDSDPDGDALTVISAFASVGQATLVGNQISYTPPANFSGTATITYRISDGEGGTSEATVTVTVNPINDDPTATAIPPVDAEDGETIAVAVADAFSDVDGDDLSFSATDLPPGLSIDPDTGLITGTITPDASQINGGVYTATITVSDGNGGTVSETITFNVSNPPPQAVDDSAATDEDTPVNIDVLANDSDPDGDPLTVTSADAQNGTVVIEADGTVTYTPNPGFNGSDTITYEISDGNGGTSIATVTVTVADINDTPVTSGSIGDQTHLDNQDINLPVAGAFSDPDGDSLSFSATGLPAGLTIDPDTGIISGTIDNSASQVNGGTYMVTVIADDGRGGTVSQSFTWEVSNPAPIASNDTATTDEDTPVNIPVLANDVDPDGDDLAVIEASAGNGTVTINPDGTLVYTPNPDFNGTDTIVYTISDGEGGESSASVDVIVTPVNDAPTTIGLPNQSGEDGQTVTIPTAGAFSDVDGDDLTFSADGLPPSLTIDPDTGVISGTLASDSSQNGPFVVTVTATDPSGEEVSTTFIYSVQNVPPVAQDDSATTPEDTPVTVAVLANDSDPDGDPLTITSASADNGTVVVNPDGTLTYTPDPDFNGQANVTYTVSDGQGGVATATLTIDVRPENDAPVAVDIPDVTNEDNQSVSVATESFFADVDGDDLTITATGLPPGLTIDPATGIISGTLDIDASQGGPSGDGVYPVTLTADDGNGGTVSQDFIWTVTNPAPTAVNDVASTDEDTAVNIAVLPNDTDPDGDPLTVVSASAPNGTVVIEADGTLTYTPDPDFNGQDTITYTISDGNGGSSTAAVIVTVNPVNDAPVAVDDSVTTDEDTPVTIGVLGNDSDVDGDDLTVTSATSPDGTVTINPDGTLEFTPDPNFNGTTTITYEISDGNGGTATATVTVTVNPINDPPVANPDSATTDEDTPVDINLIANDTDADGDPLTITAANAPNGTVVINGDGSVTYTPDPDFNGTDTITYTISDGNGGFATSTATVTVDPVNDAPVANPIAPQTNPDSTPVSLDVSGNFSDVDGDDLSFSATGLPPGLSIDANGNITGTLDPDASQGGPLGDGVYEVTVTADDGNGGTVSTTFAWTVINPPPVASNDNATTNEDTPVNIAVLANDNDPDGDPLTVIAADAPNGTVVIETDGTVTYTPDADFNGTDTITYTISDGNGGTSIAIVTVTVNAVNDAPEATPIGAQNNLDSATVSLPVGGNFSDIDGDTLTFDATGLPPGLTIDPATGEISGTIDPDASQGGPAGDGIYEVTVSADDGNGGTVSTTFSWTVINPPPVALDDSATTDEDTPVNIPVLANDNDPDGDPLTVTSATAPNGTVVIEADGTITYTPNANFNGADTITYTISDGNGGTATATVTVTVDPVNDDPTVDTPLPNLANVDDATINVPVAVNFSDLDGDNLTFSATGLPPGLSIDTDGNITGTIDPSASQGGPASDGIYTVTVTADDGNGGTVTSSFAWTITNPPPVANDDSATTNEDTPVNISVLANDNDQDGDALSVVSAVATNGTVVIETDGTVTYTPNDDFNGTDTITYTISDGEGGTSTATVTVTVSPINDDPIADPQLTNQTDEDADVIALDVSGNFDDVDGDTLTFTATGLPAGLTIDAAGNITGTIDPSASQGGPASNGIYTVTVTADDSNGGTTSSTFVWTVTNPSPTAAPDTATTDEDVPVQISVLANDNDPDGDALTVSNASAGNGTVTINADGTVTYTPDGDFNGTDTIVYTIDDGEGGTATSTVTVTVNPLNDAPTTVGLPDLTDGNNEVITVPLAPAFADAENDTLTFSATGLPDGLSIDPMTGEVTGTTTVTASSGGPGGDGVYTVTVRATDPSGEFVETTFTWTINNEPPTAVNDSFVGVEDTPQVLNVLDNDIDPDADPNTPIQIIAVEATNGIAVVNADGTITFTPDQNFNGTATVTYTIEDANGDPATAVATIVIAAVNDAPDGTPLPDRADQDGDPITIDAGVLFSDPEGDTLTFSATNLPAGLSIDPDTGEITGMIDPDASQVNGGVYQTTITADDGNGGVTDVTFVWTVTNPGPTAVDDTASTTEDNPVDIDILANDNDPDGDDLTVVSASAPNGSVVINLDGTLTYTPDPDFNGIDTITYQINDGQGGTSTASVIVTVTAENDDPTAPALPARGNLDADVIALDLSGGFADVDGDPLTFSATGLPTGLSIDAAGNITGTIDAGASQGGPGGDGIYEVTITADDGNGGTVSATFTWTVTNPAPLASDDTASTAEDTPVNIDVLANDNDPDGDALTVTQASAGNGSVVIEADGTVTYTPDQDFNGTDTISYAISDGNGGTSTATVTVTVSAENDDPTVTPIAPRENVDSAVVVVPTAGNFTDVDGDPLTFSAAGLPAGLDIDPNSGEITGTIDPAASQGGPAGNGIYEVTVTADDGNGGTVSTTFNWTITNPAPTATDDTATTAEDTPTNIDVLANDNDPDGDPLTVITASAANGTVTILPDGTIDYTPAPDFNGIDIISYQISDGNGGVANAVVTVTVDPVNDPPVAVNDTATTGEDTPVTISLLGNDSDVDGDDLTVTDASAPNGTVTINADGTVTYTPDPDFNGTDTITYTISDGNGGTDTATITVVVAPINDDPVALPDTVDTPEDTPTTISVLDNDSDVDGDDLTVTSATSPDGTVTINPDGTITFVPDPNFNGLTTITYEIDDGMGGTATATVTVNVTPVNDPPAAQDDTATTDEDTPVTVPVLDNDSDIDGDDLTVTSATATNGTVTANPDGTITYTPDPNFNGTDVITYVIDDGMGGTDTATVTVTVEPINDLPIAADDVVDGVEDQPVTIPVLANDSDPDGDPLTVTEATSPNGTVTINPDGTITFVPDPNFNGPTTITYVIDDGMGGTATATVTVDVEAVNDLPVGETDVAVTDEDTPVTLSPLANDGDPDGDPLTIVSANAPNGTVTINPDGTITYTPNPNFNGTDTIAYQVSDGMGGFDTVTVTVTVNPVNDPPIAADDVTSVDEESAVTIPVLVNDTDADGDPLTVTDASATNGTVTINPDGTVTYVPNPDFFGMDTITYTVSDGNGGTSTATVTVTVINTNEVPVDEPEAVSLIGGTTTTINVLDNASDPDGDPLEVIFVSADVGTVTLNPDGTLTYEAPLGFGGVATIRYIISDGNGGFVESFATITIVEAAADINALLDDGTALGIPDPWPVDRVLDQSEDFISTPLVILDTVNGFRDLGGLGTLNVGRPLLEAINGIRSLNGIGGFGLGENPIGDVVDYLDHIRDIRFGADRLFDPRFGDFLTESLTGFSVRQLDTGSDRLMVESIVRDRVLYVEMRDIGGDGQARIVEFQLLTRDGTPLPDWVRMDPRGLAIIERPADAETLRVIVRAIDANGQNIEIPIIIQGSTGEIQIDVPFDRSLVRAPTLDTMMAQAKAEADNETGELLAAFT